MSDYSSLVARKKPQHSPYKLIRLVLVNSMPRFDGDQLARGDEPGDLCEFLL